MRLFNDNGLPIYINKSEDLVTTIAETKAGFISLALEKNKLAIPFVEEAKYLKSTIKQVDCAYDLLKFKKIQRALLTAAGVSDKASKYFNDHDKEKAIESFIEEFLLPAGNRFIDEFIYRFLLTKGDSLGGSMRNLIGNYAEIKLTRALLSVLSINNIDTLYLDKKTKKWQKAIFSEPDIENNAKGLYWKINSKHRTLLYNKSLKIVDNKNIDLCLLNCDNNNIKNELNNSKAFLALGELKGGIDPAGADEHWKTANSALERIRTSFNEHKCSPNVLFVGAAIENSMAVEIYNQLKNKKLSYAANLTKEEQLFAMCELIINL